MNDECPDLSPWREDYGEYECEMRGDLGLGGKTVNRAVSVHMERVDVAATHGWPCPDRALERLSAPRPMRPIANVMTVPTTPAITVPSASDSMPATP